MGKYDHIDFKPTEAMAAAASRGLELRRKNKGKGGLSTSQAKSEGVGSGVQRAVNIKNRNTLSPSTVRRMKAFFDRHEKNKGASGGKPLTQDKGYIAWLIWGGNPGRSWANKIVRQMEAADKKTKKRAGMIKKLIKIANELDQLGFYKQADQLDQLVKEAISPSNLIKALKDDDQAAAWSALVSFVNSVSSGSTPSKELRMTDQEFNQLGRYIKDGKLDEARNLLGVELGLKEQPIDTSKINPFTGKPWTSGPVEEEDERIPFDELFGQIHNIIDKYKNDIINIEKARQSFYGLEKNIVVDENSGLFDELMKFSDDVFNSQKNGLEMIVLRGLKADILTIRLVPLDRKHKITKQEADILLYYMDMATTL